MSSTVIVIIVAVVVLLALAVVAGVVLNRRRRINLTEKPQVEEKPAKGGYQTGSGISFTQGGPKTAAPPKKPEPEPEPEPEPVTEPEPVEEVAPEEAEAAVEAGPVVVPAEPAIVDEVAPTEPPAPIEEIEPTSGRLERLRGRLARSRSTFGQGLLGLLGAGDLDEDSWTEVEDTLLLADLGAATTTEIVERLREELVSRKVRTADEARALLREVLVDALHPEMDRAVRALPHEANGTKLPAVVLVTGVNGTGKTTTTGKLARVLVADGRTVMLGAADTFRAAAVEQLATWAERV
ncbi:MAG: signal recognition particle receptor subunit alpha, partial [Actinomycetota bacterium]|nr:signal recognition particle receptor subunit alpha [Actinomycetota bacterium]